MASPGRKPKALAEKRVTGNPGGRSVKALVPKSPSGNIPCPDNVMGNERALGYWRHYVTSTAPEHLCPVDAPVLAMLCIYRAEWDELEARIREDGRLVKINTTTVTREDGTTEVKGGQWAPNPLIPMAKAAAEISRRLASDLSLTVAERSRVAPGGGHGGKNPSSEFFGDN